MPLVPEVLLEAVSDCAYALTAVPMPMLASTASNIRQRLFNFMTANLCNVNTKGMTSESVWSSRATVTESGLN